MTETAWIFLALAIFNGVNGIVWFYRAMSWMTKYHELLLAQSVVLVPEEDEFPEVIDER